MSTMWLQNIRCSKNDSYYVKQKWWCQSWDAIMKMIATMKQSRLSKLRRMNKNSITILRQAIEAMTIVTIATMIRSKQNIETMCEHSSKNDDH